MIDMQKQTYRMKAKSTQILWVLIGLISLNSSCTKHDSGGDPPQIKFITDPGFVSHDTTLTIGQRIRVGLDATGMGSNITFFQISFDNGVRQILLDSGLNSYGLQYRLDIIKTANPIEKWTFLVMDRDRRKDSIQLTLHKSGSNNYGKIRSFPDVLLGAQENTTTGSFFSFTTALVYSLDLAFLNQSLIDLIYYFGSYDATLSSPNEADAPSLFPGPNGIASWTIKNETRYDTTLLTPQAFDEAENDSLLLAVYDPTAGKRKVKYVTQNQVISFKSQADKIGLIKVNGLESSSIGIVLLSIKIQE